MIRTRWDSSASVAAERTNFITAWIALTSSPAPWAKPWAEPAADISAAGRRSSIISASARGRLFSPTRLLPPAPAGGGSRGEGRGQKGRGAGGPPRVPPPGARALFFPPTRLLPQSPAV